jgi:hypothetical protein
VAGKHALLLTSLPPEIQSRTICFFCLYFARPLFTTNPKSQHFDCFHSNPVKTKMSLNATEYAKSLKTLEEQREMFLWKYRDIERKDCNELLKARHLKLCNFHFPLCKPFCHSKVFMFSFDCRSSRGTILEPKANWITMRL